MFENYSKFVLKHPKAMIAVWVALFIVAVPFMAQADDVLNYDMTSMGGFDAESSDGQAIVDEHFESGLNVDSVLVIPYEDETQLNEIKAGLLGSQALENALHDRYGDSASLSVLGAFDNEGSESGVYMISFIVDTDDLNNEVGNLRDVVSAALETSGLDVRTYVTGSAAIAYDTLQGANADVAKIDPLSVLLIILLLGLFFWTLVTAAVPPLVVGTAYGIVLALMFLLGDILDIFYITKTIALVSMLGAGCDYSIFIISRYREERKSGKSKDESITEAIKWAGESVATSGMAVVIGFFVMSFFSFELVSNMAIILALGIVMAMLAALTLIPAVLAVIGDKVFWPRTIDSYMKGSRERQGIYGKCVDFSKRYFIRAGKFSTKHAAAILVAVIVLTVPMAYIAETSQDSFDMISVMPDSEGKDGVDMITEATDGGILMPTYALVQTKDPVATITQFPNGLGTLVWNDPAYILGIKNLSDELVACDDNISYALGPSSWNAVYMMTANAIAAQGVPAHLITPDLINHKAVEALPDIIGLQLTEFFNTSSTGGGWNFTPEMEIPLAPGAPPVTVASLLDYMLNVGAGLISPDGEYIQIMVIVKDEPMSVDSMNTIAEVRDKMSAIIDEGSYDYLVADSWTVGIAAILYDISEVVNGEFHWIELAVILLIYVLLFFVLGSYLTPARSLLTIMMSVIWTLGMVQLVYAQALATDVVWIVPIILFVICLGLGMDYDILLTTRIREGKVRGLSDDEAITDALSKSGSIISLCGLIMGGTFLTLLLSGSAMLQEIGFALGFAILVDSLIVVPYVVPALMHLMGQWSWKGPKFLNKNRDF